jgi:hypothetical protein
VETVELDHVGPAKWKALLDGEQQAWGPLGETLSWAGKQRHVAVLGEDGEPLALAGAVTARLAVGDGEPFDVVGIGSVIVIRVTADQPAGRIEIPMRAMWAPLRDDASWPPGKVEVLGEPF